ncbi:MAG: hypothetical protein JRG92_18400, partial [Deltaproteobacteria bacterium]|nr:hypothetical protein [Deltaproteobacteria bacterium]
EARTVFETAALTNRLWQMPGVPAQYETRMNELLVSIWDVPALLAEIDRMETLITPIAGDLSGPIQDTRDWIFGRAATISSDFSGGPPNWNSPLPGKRCLEIRGHLDADFTGTYADPLPPDLPAGSTFTPTSFEFLPPAPFEFLAGTSLTGLGTAFGFEPQVGAGKLVLRPIGLTGFPHALIFNISVDDEDVVANTPQPIPVSDSIASFLLYLDVSGTTILPIAGIVNTTVEFDEAELFVGGDVSGSLSSELAVWVPHPVPEPGLTSMYASGGVTLAVLARVRARARKRAGRS